MFNKIKEMAQEIIIPCIIAIIILVIALIISNWYYIKPIWEWMNKN